MNDENIGNYQIEAELASGSFGRVLLVRHRFLTNRIAAVKLLHIARLQSAHERARFLREAQILELLKHPHILPIYDFGIDKGFPYLVTEYAPNGSLRDLLDHYAPYPLPLEVTLSILSQIGSALHYAHQNKIIHRDLKPENILFNERGEALLADFNIAVMQTETISSTTTFIGTPSYMAPEQFQGFVSSWSDQYALGCIAYELVTGRPPFTARSLEALIQKHMRENPIPPTNFNPNLPLSVEQAILKAMEKQPFNRHTDIFTFVTALQSPSFPHDHPFLMPPSNILVISQKTMEEWVDEGIKYRGLGRYEEALVADGQALLLNPRCARAYNGKGNSLYYLRRYEEALSAYEQAIRLAPNSAIYYNNKANTLYYLKRYQEALVAYEQAIHLGHTYAQTYYGKGITLYKLARYLEALDAYEQAIQIDPNEGLLHYSKGKALKRLGRTVEAQRAYRRARRLGYRG